MLGDNHQLPVHEWGKIPLTEHLLSTRSHMWCIVWIGALFNRVITKVMQHHHPHLNWLLSVRELLSFPNGNELEIQLIFRPSAIQNLCYFHDINCIYCLFKLVEDFSRSVYITTFIHYFPFKVLRNCFIFKIHLN